MSKLDFISAVCVFIVTALVMLGIGWYSGQPVVGLAGLFFSGLSLALLIVVRRSSR